MYGSIVALKMMAEKYLGKDRKLYAAFMDQKAYGRVDRKSLWDVLMIYGADEQLFKGIRTFYKDANVSVCVDGKLSEGFGVCVRVRVYLS